MIEAIDVAEEWLGGEGEYYDSPKIVRNLLDEIKKRDAVIDAAKYLKAQIGRDGILGVNFTPLFKSLAELEKNK
jgi:hypothetical protein